MVIIIYNYDDDVLPYFLKINGPDGAQEIVRFSCGCFFEINDFLALFFWTCPYHPSARRV